MENADEFKVLSSEEIPVTAQAQTILTVSTISEDLPDTGITQSIENFQSCDDTAREGTALGNVDRFSVISTIIDLSHCDERESQAASLILKDYADMFHLDGDTLSYTDIVQHTIDLRPDSRPIFVKQYRIPEGQRAEMNRQINDLLANGIIEPSTSEWNFPLLLVPKKPNARGEKQQRLVVDFKRLNEITVPQIFPIPLIDELLEVLGSSKYFSTMDVKSAFHQILVRPEDRELLSFQTNFRKMQFVRECGRRQ